MTQKNRSALRASIVKEDAALNKRIATNETSVTPAAAPTTTVAVAEKPASKAPTTAPTAAPAKKTSAKPVTAQPASNAASTAKKTVKAKVAQVTKVTKTEKPAKASKTAKADKSKETVEVITISEKPKRDKVVRDSFSMPKSEQALLKTLRTELAKTGRIVSKSEILRAGLALLFKQKPEEVGGLVDQLDVVPKGKSKK